MEEKWEDGFGEAEKQESADEQRHEAPAEVKQESVEEPAAPARRFIKARNPDTDPRATVNVRGRWFAKEEADDAERQYAEMEKAYRKKLREQWMQTPQGKLCLELYEKFQEYKRYLEKNLHARYQASGAEVDFDEHKLFAQALTIVEQCREDRAEKNRKNLERAQMAARCQHTHLDGKRCRAPHVRGKKLCRMHQRIEDAQAAKFDLGPLEDPDSIQLSIMKLQRGLIDGSLPNKDVGQLAYLIQLAAWNVTRTTFAKRDEPEGAHAR